jgi:carbamoyltransferase
MVRTRAGNGVSAVAGRQLAPPRRPYDNAGADGDSPGRLLMHILGLTTMGESAAALLRDGQVVACAEEERFSRHKHHIGFPHQALRYCLQAGGLTLAEVDHVTHYWKPWVLGHRIAHTLGVALKGPRLFAARARRGTSQVRGSYMPMFTLPRRLRRETPGARFRFHYVDHHLSHAASTFYVSPFDEAAILTFDGAGESTTVLFAHGRGNRIEVLRRIKLPHSLGQFYSAATNFLGFDMFAGDEYKVMGMAAWGQPTFASALAREAVVCDRPGSFRLDITFLDHHLAKHHVYGERAVRVLGPPRAPDAEVLPRHHDVAASVQKVFEETFFHLLRWLSAETGSRNLCLAGGCALNSLANGKVPAATPFEHVFIQPASHDAGGALGSALWVHHARLAAPRNGQVMRHAYWGPGFEEAECRAAAEAAGLVVRRLEDDVLCAETAALLARGGLVAWFQGRMEWGPRALGNRSFLADPRRAEMKETLNRKIKLREPFRPFAPSMPAEEAPRYFAAPLDAPFMTTVAPVRPERRAEIPAVVHVDGTARPQLVERDVNPRFWALLRAFEAVSGVPVLLNTSFNVQEPIVCTPQDAVRTFLRTEVDCLVMGNLVVTRPVPPASA